MECSRVTGNSWLNGPVGTQAPGSGKPRYFVCCHLLSHKLLCFELPGSSLSFELAGSSPASHIPFCLSYRSIKALWCTDRGFHRLRERVQIYQGQHRWKERESRTQLTDTHCHPITKYTNCTGEGWLSPSEPCLFFHPCWFFYKGLKAQCSKVVPPVYKAPNLGRS